MYPPLPLIYGIKPAARSEFSSTPRDFTFISGSVWVKLSTVSILVSSEMTDEDAVVDVVFDVLDADTYSYYWAQSSLNRASDPCRATASSSNITILYYTFEPAQSSLGEKFTRP